MPFFSHPVTVEEAAVWVIQPLESRFFSVEPGWLLLRRMEHPGPQAPCLDEDTSIYVFVEDTARTTHLSHSHTHISSFFLFLFPFPPTCFSVIIVMSLGLCCGTWQRGPSRDGSVGCREGCQSRRDGSDPRRDYTHQGVTGTFFLSLHVCDHLSLLGLESYLLNPLKRTRHMPWLIHREMMMYYLSIDMPERIFFNGL